MPPVDDDGPEDVREPERKVLPFRLVPPVVEPVEPKAPEKGEIDEDAIKMLEGLIERIKAGEFHGVALVAGILDEKGRMFDCSTFCSDAIDYHALSMLGGVAMLRRRIMDELEGFPLMEDEFDDE